MEPLRLSLETYHNNSLREIAEHLGVLDQARNKRKATLVALLMEEIPHRATYRREIAALSEAERGALALVLQRGGNATVADLTMPLMLSGVVRLGDEKQTKGTRLPTISEALLSLLRKGLLVNVTPLTGTSTRRTFSPLYNLEIPPEVIKKLPQDLLKTPRPNFKKHIMAPPPQVVSRSTEDAMRRLFFVWAELHRQPGKELQAGGLYKRDLRRLARSMGLKLATEETTLRRLIEMLFALRLLGRKNGTIVAVADETALHFWERGSAVQLRALAKAYLHVGGRPTIPPTLNVGYSYSRATPHEFAWMHQQIWGLFQKITEPLWFPCTTFLQLLNHGRAGNFLFPENDVDNLIKGVSWYSWGAARGKKEAQLKQTLRETETTVFHQLLEQWQWAGMVDLGYDGQSATPVALRLSPRGVAAILRQPFEEPQREGQIILQPDFQVLAMGPVSLLTLATLERFTEREQVQPAAVSYRLNRESVYHALQTGMSVAEMLAFLTESTGQPVPQNVERTLQEWRAQHERIVIRRNVLILQVGRPERLEALAADRQLARYLHPLDERTAWVRPQDMPKVERHLWKLDLLPAFSRGPEADLPASMRWDEAGRLSPRHPVPSLYATGTACRIAEECEQGWQLTPQSVQLAVSTGFTVPEIIALVERLTGRPLDAAWRKQLQAWGRHYGSAQTAQVRLLSLESAESLAGLRKADKRISRWLRPLSKKSNLAVVNEKQWEEVCVLLAEWGVTVEEGRWW
ncbi:MAG: helicase-associated domain-containing protein [Chloroflexota bacterium]|nr:helicase-associated domain-containing protein [Chloroflexota bacterium]